MPDRTGTDWFAWFVSGSFFGMIALLATRGMQATAEQAVLILVGQASMGFAAIINFRYGSTQGSEKKTEQLAQMAQTAAVSAGTAAAVHAAASVPVPPVVPDPVRVEVVGDVKTSEGRA
jgi:hypothetical protein